MEVLTVPEETTDLSEVTPQRVRIAQHIMTLPAELRAVEDLDRGATLRVVEGTASTQARDRYKTRVNVAALERAIPGYLRNPVYCYNHNWEFPIGKVEHAERKGDGIFTRAVLMGADACDELTDKAWARLSRGVVRSQSIGWNADWQRDLDQDREGTPWWGKVDGSGTLDWVDTSAVTIPGNSEADDLRVARSLGLDASQPWLDAAPEGEAAPAPEKRSEALLGGLTLEAVTDDADEAIWRKVAAAACRVANADPAEYPDTEPAKAVLRECYARLGKAWPAGLDAPQTTIRTVKWHNDEPAILEEGTFASSFRKAAGLLEGNRNIVRSWVKAGRVLSPAYAAEVSAVATTARELADEIGALQGNAVSSPGGVQSTTSLRDALLARATSATAPTPTLKDRLLERAARGEA